MIDIARKIIEDETIRLFVYGSLMRGEEAHDQLDSAKFLGEATTAPLYSISKIEEDFYVMTDGDESIKGELYELDPELMRTVDDWEYDMYSRELVTLSDGSRAYAYLL